jgi:diadenylate cyclase
MDILQPFLIIKDLRFRDVVDISVITIITYHLYLWFWRTRAFKALVGLLMLGMVYTVARSWGLFLTTWVFQILWQVLVLLIIILFQSEIRQVLERVNPFQMVGLKPFSKSTDWLPGFIKAIFSLAKRFIGALIIIERTDMADEWITEGIQLDGEPTPELLRSVFHKESPLHDGAVLIQRGRVTKVACYLPLSSAEGLPHRWGTRHRAALGLSEHCDACIVVVSEERGEVSIALKGRMVQVNSPEHFAEFLSKVITAPGFASVTWKEKIRLALIRRWPVKLGTIILVGIIWLLLAGQQNYQVTLRVPLKIENIPSTVEIVAPVNPQIRVTVEGLRKDVSALNSSNVSAVVDVSEAKIGKRVFHITGDEISLPSRSGTVVAVQPSQIEFKIKEKS